MLAFACATDPTEDLGSNVSSSANEVILTLSLEETKTQLGKEDEENHLFPLYWSEGDKISVNGVESNALSKEQAGSKAAEFKVNAKTPYRITYPAVSTDKQVYFESKQTHTDNTTFGSGVTTMYGYSEDGNDIELHHLTGILKIGVVGSKTLTLAQISTIDRAPIAGSFDFDFEKGVATASNSSEDVISYSFGKEGVSLSSTPTYMHIAVPAGVYNELYVTLYDNEGGVMYATVQASNDNPETDKVERPLAAGKVRKFTTNITYTPNEQVYVVYDYDSLKTFAETIGSLNKDVLFVNDVVIPEGETWTSIDNSTYKNRIIGNGYAIKGLTKPLFATTYATIESLHLEDVNIVDSETAIIGTFANTFYGKMKNCSAKGFLTINNTSFNTETNSKFNQLNVGGMIGRTKNGEFVNCTNYVNVTITAMGDSSIAYYKPIGGFVGLIWGDTTSLDGVVNRGNIYYNEITTGSVVVAMGGIFGCTHNSGTNTFVKFANCTNYGTLSTPSQFSCGGSLYVSGITSGITYAGLDTCSSTVCDGLKNYGNITINGTCANSLSVAGIFAGKMARAQYSNSLNEGNITINASVTTGNLLVGGILAWEHIIDGNADTPCLKTTNVNKGDITIADDLTIGGVVRVGGIAANMTHQSKNACLAAQYESSDNYGEITVGAITVTGGEADANLPGASLQVAGLYSVFKNGKITNCHNKAEATISVAPASVTGGCRVAGLIGYIAFPNYASLFVTATDCSNSANITAAPTSATFTEVTGGLGYLSSTATSATTTFTGINNSGVITYSGTSTSTAEVFTGDTTLSESNSIGGIVATSAYLITFSDCHNTNKIVISENAQAAYLNVGGLIGRTAHFYGRKTTSLTNCTNSGEIDYKPASVTGESNVGGIVGYVSGNAKLTNLLAMTTCENSGAVKIGGSIDKICAAGICGHIKGRVRFTGTNNTATGTVTVNTTARSGNTILGGLLGKWDHYLDTVGDNPASLTSCNNYANVNINSGGSGHFYCGGIAGYMLSTNAYIVNFDSVTNNGSIISNCDSSSSSLYLGGMAGMLDEFTDTTDTSMISFTNCNNTSTTNSPSQIKITNGQYSNVFVAGFAGYSYARLNLSNCTNSQPLLIDAQKIGSASIGAMCGKLLHGGNKLTSTVDTFTNTADCTISAKSMGNVSASMFLGYFNTSGGTNTMSMTANNVTNSGTLTVTGASTSACYYGGMCGYARLGRTSLTMTNSTMGGSMNIGGTLTGNMLVGGFVGNQSAVINLTDCVNECPITIDTETSATCGAYNTGGFAGSQIGTISLTRCQNKSQVSVSAKSSTDTHIGGVIGKSGATCTLVDVTNSGNVIAGPSNKLLSATELYVGGLIGSTMADNTYTLTAPLVNTGNIVAHSTSVSTADKYNVGGIVGSLVVPITGARCFCDIIALNGAKVGFITGSPYAEAIKSTNCHIGGNVCTALYGTGVIDWVPIDYWEYLTYIYGGEISADEATASKLGWLEDSITGTPRDPNGDVMATE